MQLAHLLDRSSRLQPWSTQLVVVPAGKPVDVASVLGAGPVLGRPAASRRLERTTPTIGLARRPMLGRLPG